MIGRFGEMLLEYLKAKPYWVRIQPAIILLFGFAAFEFFAYQYLVLARPGRPEAPALWSLPSDAA